MVTIQTHKDVKMTDLEKCLVGFVVEALLHHQIFETQYEAMEYILA